MLKSCITAGLATLLCLCLSGCDLFCSSGSGIIDSRKLDQPMYSEIILKCPASVTVKQGDEHSLFVTADDNVLENLDIQVVNGRMTISTKGCFKNLDQFDIEATLTNLKGLHIDGMGDIVANDGFSSSTFRISLDGTGTIAANISTGELETKVNGAGAITLSGNAQRHTFKLSGAGELNAFDLETRILNVDISGAGRASVRVFNELNAKVSGAGSVEYLGSPKVETDISGSGQVNPAG